VRRVEDSLSDEERRLLRCGLSEWGGPANPTDDLARAFGFRDVADFDQARKRLRLALHERESLSAEDWRRVLVATEVVFVSDVFGSGQDWSITTGLSDGETIALLRGLQRKLGQWRLCTDASDAGHQLRRLSAHSLGAVAAHGTSVGTYDEPGHVWSFARCTCGWEGPLRLTEEQAMEDAKEHARNSGT
jgi:hypothetical protein